MLSVCRTNVERCLGECSCRNFCYTCERHHVYHNSDLYPDQYDVGDDDDDDDDDDDVDDDASHDDEDACDHRQLQWS